jgi:hypothetical protein
MLETLPQFLGKAITGLGGGSSKMYVIEEDGGQVSAILPKNFEESKIMMSRADKERPEGRNKQVHQFNSSFEQ